MKTGMTLLTTRLLLLPVVLMASLALAACGPFGGPGPTLIPPNTPLAQAATAVPATATPVAQPTATRPAPATATPIAQPTATRPAPATAVSASPTPVPATPTPTSTPAATALPTPHGDGPCSYVATFIGDVTIPDDTVLVPGAAFVKTWRLRNDGTCIWGMGGYALHSIVFVGGDPLGAPGAVEIQQTVQPGSNVDLSLTLTAPVQPGIYRGNWLLQVDNGPRVGVGRGGDGPFYVQIVVAGPLPTPPALPITTWRVGNLLVGPGSPGRLYALERSEVYTAAGVGGGSVRLLVSDDLGASWAPFAGGLPNSDLACVNALSMDYMTVDALYVSTCQGIYRWMGGQWQLFSHQVVGALAITYGKPNVIWATGYAPGPYVLKSEDGGGSWQRADADLVSFTGLANIGIDPRDGKTVYGMINPKYAGSYLRRADATGHWVTMPVPDPNTGYTYIGFTVDGGTGALYVVRLSLNGPWQLWRTRNPNEADVDQVRWEMVHEFADTQAYFPAIVLSSGKTPQGLAIFVRFDLGNCSPAQGIPCTSIVQRSLDGGQTWSTVPLPEN